MACRRLTLPVYLGHGVIDTDHESDDHDRREQSPDYDRSPPTSPNPSFAPRGHAIPTRRFKNRIPSPLNLDIPKLDKFQHAYTVRKAHSCEMRSPRLRWRFLPFFLESSQDHRGWPWQPQIPRATPVDHKLVAAPRYPYVTSIRRNAAPRRRAGARSARGVAKQTMVNRRRHRGSGPRYGDSEPRSLVLHRGRFYLHTHPAVGGCSRFVLGSIWFQCVYAPAVAQVHSCTDTS